jgi:hypothetical protein
MTREEFISDLSHWNSYFPLLYEALVHTTGDVIELGIGDGSTVKLAEYCKGKDRKLFSYESNKEWFLKFGPMQSPIHRLEAPGEMRKYNISMFCNTAQVIIAHDAEPSNDHGYKIFLVKNIVQIQKAA